MTYHYDYPRPAVTVDIVLFARLQEDSSFWTHYRRNAVLLIKRGKEPFKDCWALPGGFVDANEDLDDAAARELVEETGVKGVELTQVFAVGTPGRDPRGHTISIVYAAFENSAPKVTPGDDAVEYKWITMADLPNEKLAFDHADIIPRVYEALR